MFPTSGPRLKGVLTVWDVVFSKSDQECKRLMEVCGASAQDWPTFHWPKKVLGPSSTLMWGRE